MKLLDVLPAVLVLALLFSGSSVSVEALSPVMKRVTVGSRSYLVTRLGEGVYNVTTTDAKASLSFGQNGVHSETGDSKSLALLRSDIQQFPKGLFA